MMTYRLPAFLSYLFEKYQGLYQAYCGRLIELFPTAERTDRNLSIAAAQEPTENNDDAIYGLWRSFEG